jgi:hypothetical protein
MEFEIAVKGPLFAISALSRKLRALIVYREAVFQLLIFCPLWYNQKIAPPQNQKRVSRNPGNPFLNHRIL